VNFGGRGNKGGAERAIEEETQTISGEYQFPGPAAGLSKQPLLLLFGSKDFFAFYSASVPCFNSLEFREQEPMVAEHLKPMHHFHTN
jgi:hypothetical protein